MSDLGKILVTFGLVLVLVGAALMLTGRLPKLPLIGRLPGDIVIRRDNYTFVFPLTTCLLVSLILSLLFHWLRR